MAHVEKPPITTMKTLLITTAVLEAATGVGLLAMPVILVSILLGSTLDTPSSLTVARVAGAAILSLGVACWLASSDGQSRAARGVIVAMLLYNVTTVALLVYADIGLGQSGVGLRPAVGLHLAMAIWCVACLQIKL
jgi:hypothetical protein